MDRRLTIAPCHASEGIGRRLRGPGAGECRRFQSGLPAHRDAIRLGETWGDPTLTPRERSILNLGMIAALGKCRNSRPIPAAPCAMA